MDPKPSPGSNSSGQSIRAHDDPETAERFLALEGAGMAAGALFIIDPERGQTSRPVRLGELLVLAYRGGELAVESMPGFGAPSEIALPDEVYG